MALQTKSISANGSRGHHKFTLNVTENNTSVENNTSHVSWSLILSPIQNGWDWYYSNQTPVTYNVIFNGKTYTGSVMNYNGSATITIASGTETVEHNDDGNKTISFGFSISSLNYDYLPGSANASGNMALTFIARASQPSLVTYPENTQNVGDFGTTIPIHMNRKSNQFTHTVRYEFGDLSGTCINADTGKAATGIENGFTWKIPESFMNQIPEDLSGSGRIYVDTYNGSTKIGTKYSGFTATVPESVKPSVSMTLEDVTGVDDIYGSPVKGLSKIKITVNATPAYSSPIASYQITANGVKYSTKEATTGFLTGKDSVITVTATDKRERPNSDEYEMTVQDYAPPSITALTAIRCNQDGTTNKRGTYIKATFSAVVYSMGGKNTAAYSVKYKKTSEPESEFVDLATDANGKKPSSLNNNFAPSNQSFVFAAAAGNSYDVVVYAVDRHNASNPTTESAKAPTAFAIFSWRGFKNTSGIKEDGAGIGKVPEKPNVLQIGWDTEFEESVRGKVFGLGTLELIPDNSNANDYVIPGVYSVENDASAATISNLPRNVGGRLIVSDSTGKEPQEGSLWEYKEQLFLPHDIGRGGVPYVRQIRRANSAQWVQYGWQSFALFSYPVGSIYIAYNHESPAELFGGTWLRISNAFLWATTSGGTIGQTGGEQTHTLTANEIPKHRHSLTVAHENTGNSKTPEDVVIYRSNNQATGFVGTVSTSEIGGGAAHNNMPPYIQVSVWRRTE